MRTTTSSARSRRLLSAFVGGFAALALIIGGGSAHAFWSARASVNGTAAAPAVSITQAAFEDVSGEYRNSTLLTPGSTTLARAQAFTVANTGSADGTATVRIRSSDPVAGSVAVTAWRMTAGAPCNTTIPSGVASSTGTWASTDIAGVDIAARAAATICVRTTVADRASVATDGGSLASTATAQATLVSGGWNASSATASATLKTLAIFPLDRSAVPTTGSRWAMVTAFGATDRCMDVTQAMQTAGTVVGLYSCFPLTTSRSTASNRAWQFIPDASDRSLVTVRPASGPGLRLAAGSDSVARLAAATPGDATQKWYIQNRGATGYQLVNAADGRCLNVGSGAASLAQLTTTECDQDGVALSFSAPITPAVSGGSWSGVAINVGFYRLNANGAAFSARVFTSTGAVVNANCSTLGGTAGAASDATRTVTCSLPSGSYTAEVIANTAAGGVEVIHRFSLSVSAFSSSLGAVQ